MALLKFLQSPETSKVDIFRPKLCPTDIIFNPTRTKKHSDQARLSPKKKYELSNKNRLLSQGLWNTF